MSSVVTDQSLKDMILKVPRTSPTYIHTHAYHCKGGYKRRAAALNLSLQYFPDDFHFYGIDNFLSQGDKFACVIGKKNQALRVIP